MYPLHGRLAIFASDFPVSTNPSPFVAIETGVTRNLPIGEESGVSDITDMDDPAYLLWPEERLTLTQMLRGYTIDGAYAMYAEEETGSLETGKSATPKCCAPTCRANWCTARRHNP